MPGYLSGLPQVADRFRPVHLRSISFSEPGKYRILLDTGDAGDLSVADRQAAAAKLMEYFRIGLRLPDSTFWVNLRPDAPDNIIDPLLEKTDMGKVLLEADLQLKKDLAGFTNPATAEGRKYWDRLYAKAETLFKGEDCEIPTYFRPWIVPGEVIIGESESGAYVYKATLKVCLEEDWLSRHNLVGYPEVQSARMSLPAPEQDARVRQLNEYSSQLVRELILPKLAREVNASKRYAALRQVYYSLILAQWAKKQRLAGSVERLGAVDNRDLTGLVSKSPWSKDGYFQEYRRSVAEGEYRSQEQAETLDGITIRQYTSGGMNFDGGEFFAMESSVEALISAGLDGGIGIEMSIDDQSRLASEYAAYADLDIIPEELNPDELLSIAAQAQADKRRLMDAIERLAAEQDFRESLPEDLSIYSIKELGVILDEYSYKPLRLTGLAAGAGLSGRIQRLMNNASTAEGGILSRRFVSMVSIGLLGLSVLGGLAVPAFADIANQSLLDDTGGYEVSETHTVQAELIDFKTAMSDTVYWAERAEYRQNKAFLANRYYAQIKFEEDSQGTYQGMTEDEYNRKVEDSQKAIDAYDAKYGSAISKDGIFSDEAVSVELSPSGSVDGQSVIEMNFEKFDRYQSGFVDFNLSEKGLVGATHISFWFKGEEGGSNVRVELSNGTEKNVSHILCVSRDWERIEVPVVASDFPAGMPNRLRLYYDFPAGTPGIDNTEPDKYYIKGISAHAEAMPVQKFDGLDGFYLVPETMAVKDKIDAASLRYEEKYGRTFTQEMTDLAAHSIPLWTLGRYWR
jgi:hypothetical protein